MGLAVPKVTLVLCLLAHRLHGSRVFMLKDMRGILHKKLVPYWSTVVSFSFTLTSNVICVYIYICMNHVHISNTIGPMTGTRGQYRVSPCGASVRRIFLLLIACIQAWEATRLSRVCCEDW